MTIERRRAPRIRTALPALLITEDGVRIEAVISDISNSGIAVMGDRGVVENLLPNLNRQEKYIPIAVNCHFDIPTNGNQAVPVETTCSIVYAQRASTTHYKMGLQFAGFSNGCDVLLAEYILKQMPEEMD
jgi:hypothetical protein